MVVFVSGFGLVRITRDFYNTIEDMVFKAINNMEKMNVNLADTDTVVVSNAFSGYLQNQTLLASLIAEDIGLKNVATFNVENGQASGISAVILAKQLIESGFSKKVLVIGVEKTSDYNSGVYNSAMSQLVNAEFEAFYGGTLASNFALIARAYLDKYEVKEEELAYWPILMHENAVDTDHSQLRFKITLEQVMKSEIVSSPLRTLHSPPISDGAAVLLLEKGGDQEKLAKITNCGIMSSNFELTHRKDLHRFESVANLLRYLEGKNFKVDRDFGYVEISDDYTIAAALVAEELKLSEPGKFFADIKEGKFRNGDRVVLNTTGGTKARGYPIGALGVYQIAEAVAVTASIKMKQNQPSSDRSLVIGIGGAGSLSSFVVIERV